jgi:hypothetical protein
VLIGKGDGTFEQFYNATTISDTSLQGLAAADLDLDGKLDLVVAHQGGGFIYLLAGRGDGIFSSSRSRSPLLAGAQPMGLITGQFDNDAKPDMVATIPNQNQIAVCMNDTKWSASTIPVVLSVAGASRSSFLRGN